MTPGSPSWVRSSRSFSLKSWRPGVALNLRGEKPQKKRIQISGYLWPIPSNYWFGDRLKITILKAGRSTQIPVLESEKGNFLYSCCSKLEGWEIEATDPLQWLQNHSWLDFLGGEYLSKWSGQWISDELERSAKSVEWYSPKKKLTCPPMEKERHRDPATFKGDMGSFPGVVFEVRGRGKWNGSSKNASPIQNALYTLRFNLSLHIHKKTVMLKRPKKTWKEITNLLPLETVTVTYIKSSQ